MNEQEGDEIYIRINHALRALREHVSTRDVPARSTKVKREVRTLDRPSELVNTLLTVRTKTAWERELARFMLVEATCRLAAPWAMTASASSKSFTSNSCNPSTYTPRAASSRTLRAVSNAPSSDSRSYTRSLKISKKLALVVVSRMTSSASLEPPAAPSAWERAMLRNKAWRERWTRPAFSPPLLLPPLDPPNTVKLFPLPVWP